MSPSPTITRRLLQVFLYRVGVSRADVVGVSSRATARPALAQEVPATVERYRDVLEAPAIGGERFAAHRVALLAPLQPVLLLNERLDAAEDRLVVHGS